MCSGRIGCSDQANAQDPAPTPLGARCAEFMVDVVLYLAVMLVLLQLLGQLAKLAL